MLNDIWSISTAIPLALCSVITLALVAERCWCLIKLKRLSDKQQQQAISALKQGDINSATDYIRAEKPFYHIALDTLLAAKQQPREQRDEQVSFELKTLQRQMKRRLSALVTVATLAPMLGLLGTIIGLMRSFHDIGEHQGPVEPAIVADGLWQALSTTAVGLVIAVVCVLTHALLASKVRHALSESSELLNRISHALGQ